jgi:hypothetical protein
MKEQVSKSKINNTKDSNTNDTAFKRWSIHGELTEKEKEEYEQMISQTYT